MKRHPADTLTYEDWMERVERYRGMGLGEMLKWAEASAKRARKAGRFRE